MPGHGEHRQADQVRAVQGCTDRQDVRYASIAGLNYAEWIARITERDEGALEALYEATVHRVYGLALSITGVPAMAEEVVEEVYFQVWSTARSFDPQRGGALTWLLVICRSQALMKLRSDASARHIDPGVPVDCEEAMDSMHRHSTQLQNGRDTDPHALLFEAEQNSSLYRALAQLEGRERQLLGLAFFRDLTYGEIARQMAMPLGTVKSCIRKALSCLRVELERNQ